jgi:hypothetical protein
LRGISLVEPASYRAMPWRNGLGTTIELLKQDLPSGGGFAWRLSMADVASDGEFSNFTGYDRTLLLLEGNGITLDCDGERQCLDSPLQAARFRGEAATVATLHDGPVKDFNVMTHRQTCTARVSGNSDTEPSQIDINADLLLLYAVDAALRIASGELGNTIIPCRHLLAVRGPQRETLRCRGAGYIATQITLI